MEDLLRPIYQERASNPDTLGVLLVEKMKENSPSTDNFDAILIVLVKGEMTSWYVKHYQYTEQNAALHIVGESQLKQWLRLGTNRRSVEWVLDGKILFERNDYITKLRNELHDFPLEDRKQRIGVEFAKVIMRLTNGKDLYVEKQYLDSFNHLVHALHHLARLSVIDHGFHPEVTVWNQVKKIEPEIFKLYQELVESNEPIAKRIELILLASEVAVSTRARIGSSHLIEIMKTKSEPWTFAELKNHKEIKDYSLDLAILLDYLASKGIINVELEKTKSQDMFFRNYKVN